MKTMETELCSVRRAYTARYHSDWMKNRMILKGNTLANDLCWKETSLCIINDETGGLFIHCWAGIEHMCVCVDLYKRMNKTKWTGSLRERRLWRIFKTSRVVDLLHAMYLCACTEAKPWNWLQCHLNLVEYNGIDTKETICSALSLCQNRKASPAASTSLYCSQPLLWESWLCPFPFCSHFYPKIVGTCLYLLNDRNKHFESISFTT